MKTKIVLTLLFLSAVVPELLSGSTPPLYFFNPVTLAILCSIYGGTALLLREARVRWRLQWSFLFLAATVGILVEGLLVQSFFNPGHVDLGVLSRYGVLAGVQWPWAIELIVIHATLSLLLPLALVDWMWPEYREVSLLGRRGVVLCLLATLGVTSAYVALVVLSRGDPMYHGYQLDPLPNLAFAALLAVLALLAYALRRTRIESRMPLLPLPIFSILSFLSVFVTLILPNAMAESGAPAGQTVLFQLIWLALMLLFAFLQLYNRNVTPRHAVAVVFSSLLPFVILAFLQGFFGLENPDDTTGMQWVGLIFLAFLIGWRRRALRGAQEASQPDPGTALA